MIKKIIIICTFISIVPMALAQTNDFGTWWGVEVRKTFLQDFRATLEIESRLNENSLALRNVYVEPGIRYAPLRWLAFTVQYRFDNRYQLEENYFIHRHRISLDVTFSYPLKRFEFEYRNRTQFNWDDYFAQDVYYPQIQNRNALQVSYKWPRLPFKNTVSAELWVPLEYRANLERLRIQAGIEYTIKKIHKLQLRFIFQTELNQNNPGREYITALKYILAI